ncbi:MAG: alpha-2-macroglobulin [Treponema sp.]|jgi:uncharacterized protein YfaS (alpha-2-macroglobulin family)|nr:alpha-2-macroglobulin [Treponema sp.]
MMKRLLSLCLTLLLCGAVLGSCKKRDRGGQGGGDYGLSSGTAVDYGIELATLENLDAAFTLDYRPLAPEPEQSVDTLSPAAGAGVRQSSQGPSVIPGLRRLSAYKTEYYNPEREAARIRTIQEAQSRGRAGQLEADGSSGPLTVVDWGPQGFFSSEIQRPSIYVIFSQPMVALSALGPQSANSPLVSITPALKGSFRWYGTGFLSFEAEEPCQSQQIYTIRVNPQAASLHGQRISGETTFTFHTEELKIQSMRPGEDFRKRTGFVFSNNDVPPEAAGQIGLVFNYPVNADIARYLEVAANSGVKQFTLTQDAPNKITLRLGSGVEFDTPVKVTLKRGARSFNGTLGTQADQVHTFHTPGPFKVSGCERIPSYGKYLNLVDINFSCRLNQDTVQRNISLEPAMTIGSGNIEIFGNVARIYNLPVGYGDTFNIRINGNVEDVYGRKLSAPYTAEIKVPDEPPPRGDIRFLNNWEDHRILEAQFDPRYLFEYKNIVHGSYRLSSKNNPFSPAAVKTDTFTLNPGEKNYRYFEEMDLKPYLNSRGRGFVSFDASIRYHTADLDWRTKTYRTGTSETENGVTLQVTDLGLSVRYGFNKAAVLVTSLSTGEPVEGAEVALISPSDIEGNDLSALPNFGSARTGADGLAVIPIAMGRLRSELYRSGGGNYYNDRPYVSAEKDGDRVIFEPSSHNIWAYGVPSGAPHRAEEIGITTFMFSDRGLYKPGEILTFRGVDRTLSLGNYLIYRGAYKVTLEEDYYDGEVIAEVEGEVSESGGFYGNITLPDDLTPRTYRLTYRRANWDENSANIPITVAYFERLKFQAGITRPPVTVYAGDDINLNLKASYLSGGSLSGASWNGDWYRETAYFAPETPETKGYTFGPRNAYEGRRELASSSGMLSADGGAVLSQKTAGGTVTGAVYRYSVEARVTDISNQMIAASQSVLVHPARFYLGVARPQTRGFPRAGQDLSFNYIAVTPEGTKAPDGLFPRGEAGKLTVELSRDEWHLIQQQGVNGYIYDQYVKEVVSDGTQKIDLQNAGSFKIKPARAGYYTVRLSAQDREGKKVLTEYSFYVTGSNSGYWNMNNAQEIRLTADRGVYDPGDTAQVLLQSSLPSGWYLITVEREGIFTEEVRHFDDTVSVIEVPIARNFVPVVYVSVSSYSVRSGPPSHSYGSPDLDKPKGYFGTVMLRVNPRVKAFSVKVESDKQSYRPGDTVTMTLTAEREGRPLPNAELTLMAVDRGVLDLINYHVPDPIQYFYDEGKFPLSVWGGDSRAWLMDPVTYSVKNLAGGGGDDSKLEERKDFNPTAVFEPMLVTGEDGKVTCSFKLPDNLTTYRVTVFGVRGDLFSLKESELAARNKINVREVLPRRLRERDTAEAGVLITNLDSAAHSVSVALSITDPGETSTEGRIKQAGRAFVDGTAERRITLKSGENGVIFFDVAAVSAGTVRLNFTVRSDALNERLIQELIIEKPYVMETVTTTGSVAGGGQGSGAENQASEGLVIPSWADNGVGNLSVTLDATRLGLLESAVDYLFHYPYGCMEQRSSAVMPLVLFGEYLDVFGLKNSVSDPRAVVAAEIKSWVMVQRPDGGFPYWPSGTSANTYVSLRIAHIYAIAKAKNIPLPPSFNVDGLCSYLDAAYQRMQSRNASWDQSYLQSYMLYVMSLLGRPVDASRAAEILTRKNADPSVLAFVGMTYRNIGRSAEAANTAARLRNLLRPTGRGVDITVPPEMPRYNYYGNMVEQLALTLEFFVQQFPGDDINTRLLYSLLEHKRAGGYWNNTAVTVRVLSAVDTLIRAENLTALDLTGQVSLSGNQLFSASFKGLGAKPVGKTFNFKEAPLASLARDTALPLSVSRSGRGSLYYTASLRYAIPSELLSFRDEGLGVFMTLYDVDTGQELTGTALVSGKTYRARLRVSSGRDRTYVAMRVPIPSGAEILDAAFAVTAAYPEADDQEPEQYGSRSWVSYQTILDNEVQYFWDNFRKGESTVQFLFRTARRGVYPTPPVQVECMYEPEIFGRSRGLLYTIE